MHFPTIFLIIFVLLLIAILGNCGRRRKDSIKIRSEFSSTRSNPLDEALESAEKKFKEVMGNLKNKTVKTAKSMVRSVSEVITKREDYKLKYEDILIQLKKLNNPEEISAKYEKISAEENRIRNRYSDHLNNILNYDFKQLIENLTEHLDKYKKKILKAIKTNFFNEGTDVEDEIITKIKKHIIKYSQDEEEAFIQINKIYNSTWQGCNAIIEINKEIRTKQDKINKRYDKYYNEYEIYLEQLNVANNKIKQKIFNDVFVYFNNINKEELCDVKGEHNYNINPEVAKKSHSWEKIVLKIKPVPEKEIKTQIKNLNKNINPIWEQIARKIICLKYIYEDLIEANKRCKNISSFINNHKQLQFEFSTEKTSSEVNDMGIRLNHLVHKPAIMYFIYLKKGTYDALSYTERDMMEELNQKTNELFKVWGGINKDFDYLMNWYGIHILPEEFLRQAEFEDTHLKVYFNFSRIGFKFEEVKVPKEKMGGEIVTAESSMKVSELPSAASSGHIIMSEIQTETEEENESEKHEEEDSVVNEVDDDNAIGDLEDEVDIGGANIAQFDNFLSTYNQQQMFNHPHNPYPYPPQPSYYYYPQE